MFLVCGPPQVCRSTVGLEKVRTGAFMRDTCSMGAAAFQDCECID
jgi:hypothetical protein